MAGVTAPGHKRVKTLPEGPRPPSLKKPRNPPFFHPPWSVDEHSKPLIYKHNQSPKYQNIPYLAQGHPSGILGSRPFYLGRPADLVLSGQPEGD